MLNRAMNILEQSLGPDHVEAVETLLQLARLREFREENDVAETMFRKSCDIRESALGPDHPDVAEALFALADHLYNVQGQIQEASELLNRALDIWERTLGLKHPLVEQESRFIKKVLADLYQEERDDEDDDDGDDDEFDDDVEF